MTASAWGVIISGMSKAKKSPRAVIIPHYPPRPLRLEWVAPETLTDNPANWRTHPAEQMKPLDSVLSAVGWAGACLFNEATGRLIDGHARKKVAIERAEKEVPVLVGTWTPEQEKLILATLDPLAALATMDEAALRKLLEEIETDDPALNEMLERLAAGVEVQTDPPKAGPDEDTAPPVPPDPVTKPLDVWILGKHRVMCGDSTNPAHAARLMAGAVPDLMFADPPYNVGETMSGGFYAGWPTPSMNGLAAVDWDKGFNMAAFLAVADVFRPVNGTAYVCTSRFLAPEIWAWMDAQKATHVSYVVWCKPNPMPSLAKRHPTWATELICYATWGKHTFNFPEEGHSLSWWEINKNNRNDYHVTQKPVAVPSRAIQLSSNPGDLVTDPFLGSGTTLIACEQMGRVCYGMELSPGNCDVIVKRWETLTGGKAVLEAAAGGVICNGGNHAD